MARVSIVIGMLLCGLSAVGMIGSQEKDAVQFIPLMLGIPLLFCGVVSLNPHRRRFAMRFAATLAAIGGMIGIAFVVYRPEAVTPEQIMLEKSAWTLMGLMILLCWGQCGLQILAEVQGRRVVQAEQSSANASSQGDSLQKAYQPPTSKDESVEVRTVKSSPDP